MFAFTIFSGAGKYGQKTVLDQADQFVQCANQHLVLYQPPEVSRVKLL